MQPDALAKTAMGWFRICGAADRVVSQATSSVPSIMRACYVALRSLEQHESGCWPSFRLHGRRDPWIRIAYSLGSG